MENEHQQKQNILTPISIVIAGALIATGVFFSGTGNPVVNEQGQVPPKVAVDIAKVKTEGQPFLGNPNAPVTIAYWFDYQCPFCKKFEVETMPQLLTDYVNTGKVKIVYKDFQFVGPDSVTASLISRAVWDVAPEIFYDWHKAVYEKQDAENKGWGSKNDILTLTRSVLGKANADRVGDLIVSKKAQYEEAMAAATNEGASMGLTSTPSMIIGKQAIIGAQPYSVFKQLIELALKDK